MLNRNAEQKLSNSGNRRWTRISRLSRGQSMVEFAMGATLSIAIMLIGVQFAIIGQAALAVSQGSSALARYASVNPGALGTYNGTATLSTAAKQLLSPSITNGSNLTVTVNSYTGTTTTQTSTPIATQDRVVISMSFNASSKIFLPSHTLLGVSFPTSLSASDSQLYE